VLTCGFSIGQIDSSGYINVGDDKIFYETAGKGSVLIFIHDGLVHREIWDGQFSFFSQNFKVIRYDRRGYGNSLAASGAYSNVEDLNSLYTQLKIDKACLIAMSSGGALAIDFTLKFPEKVSSLILVGAVVGGFSYTQHFFSRGGHSPSDLKTTEERRLYYAVDDPYAIFHENKAAKEKVAQLVKDNPQKGHGSAAGAPPGEPAYRRLNEIKIPTLILVGEFDIPDVHAHAGAINAGIANSKRDIIPKSGHLIPIEQPTLFNNKVKEFLEAVSTTSVPGSLEDDTKSIRVPEGNRKPVLLDGLFSPGEWEDAEKIDIHPNVSLYLKKYGGHIFIGIKITPHKTSVIDMFISPDGKSIHHLHASAQISERLVNENSGPWDNPSFTWGYSVDWYANEIRWDNGKMQDLMKKGKSQNEAQEMSYFKYDGFEFQIKQSKFSSDQWLLRIEVPMAPDFDNPIIFPSLTEMKSTKGWIRLELE
jgi:pimeloyl-ACP methyl ester carboxylesterase